jgi:hypothetical protein
MLFLTFAEYRRRRFRLGALLLWLVPWVLLVLGSIYPPLVWFILEVLSLGLPIHIATALSIAVLFSITYLLYVRVVDLERKLRTLVQSQTVQQVEGLEGGLRETESATGNRKSSLLKRSTRKDET